MTIKNSYWLGVLAGIVFPALVFGLLYAINAGITAVVHSVALLSMQKLTFISAALNILPFRYLFVKLHLDKTSGGLLIITVILVILVMIVFP